MMKFKIGDKVTVRGDITPETHETFVDDMEMWLCQTVTITQVNTFKGRTFYHIKEDMGEWIWKQEMFIGDIQLTIE